jgi:surfactin family lipopeptide synthetase A
MPGGSSTFGGRRMVNAYGPAEVAAVATVSDVDLSERPPIGTPLPGLRVVLLGPDLRPVPPGEPGEIAVGGVGIGRGYLGRPGLTAQRFVPDPTGGVPGARLFRTGDIGAWRPDGRLDLLGRADQHTISAGSLTPVEARLADTIRRLLGGMVTPGAGDDFFALGGHSLLVGRLAAAIRARFAVEVSVRDLFEARTVAGMARLVESGGRRPALPPVLVTDRSGLLPLSFSQERVWHEEQLWPGNLAHNAQATIRIEGPLNAAVLRDTLTEIVRRHEILRTRFRSVEGGPVQEVCLPAPVHLPVIDVSIVDEAFAQEMVRTALRQRFDPARPPLVRWKLLRHSRLDHTLVQVAHTLVHDGWSLAVLLDEIERIYPALAAGRSSPLPEPAVQFADFAVWQREWLRGEVLDAHLEYWTSNLAGAPDELELPTDRPRSTRQSLEGDALHTTLSDGLSDRLRRFARANDITLFATMLAGFTALLHRYSGQSDVVVGTEVADRRTAEIEQMIGMVANTLPLRVRVDPDDDFAALARRVQTVAVEALQWQSAPLRRIVEAAGVRPDQARNPLFQAMFSFHDAAVPDLDFAGLRGTVTEQHNGSARTDLTVVVIPRAEQRAGRAPRDVPEPTTIIWGYATALFDRSTAEEMCASYVDLLERATAAESSLPIRALAPVDRERTSPRAPAVPEQIPPAVRPAAPLLVDVDLDRLSDEDVARHLEELTEQVRKVVP